MTWTDEDKQRLLHFKEIVDSDDIKCKEIIKKLLLSNKYILHVLNNEDEDLFSEEKQQEFSKLVLNEYKRKKKIS